MCKFLHRLRLFFQYFREFFGWQRFTLYLAFFLTFFCFDTFVSGFFYGGMLFIILRIWHLSAPDAEVTEDA